MRRSLLRSSLLVVAAAHLLLLVLQLYRGTPLFGLRQPLVLLPAGVIAGAILARELLRGPTRRLPVVAGCLAFLLFVSNDRLIASSDSAPTHLIPYGLLRHGTLSLDPFDLGEPLPYWVSPHEGRRWSEYPVATALLALPVYLPAALGSAPPDASPKLQKLAASLLAALSVGFVMASALLLGASARFAGLVALLYAAGSPVLSTNAQALWQHGAGALAIAASVWTLLRARASAHVVWLAGLLAGLATAARPTNVLFAGAMLLPMLLRGRRTDLLRYGAAAALPVALVALYNAFAFGAPWSTGYDHAAPKFGAESHLVALLFSPTRGLVLYVPWATLAMVGALRGGREEPFYPAAALATASTIVLYAFWPMWWGGWSYGPRLLADVSPLLALCLVPLAAASSAWVRPALLGTGGLAILLHVWFAFSSRSPRMRAVWEIDTAEQAMEWRRFPPAGLLLGAVDDDR